MNLIHQRVVSLTCLFFLCACSHNAIAPKEPGVFAETSTGLVKLTIYAEPELNNNYRFPNLRHSPASQTIRAFYVNMPGTSITNAKVFWAAEVLFTIHEDRYTPLPIQTECTAPDSYKIQCYTLSQQHAGYGLLKITMPNGAPARMYVVKLGG